MAKVVVIGLDGATFRIMQDLIDKGELPNLARVKQEGSSGVLTSTIHPFSAQAWSSFMTGKNPGRHGILDFIHHEEGSYGLKFVNASDRQGDTLWGILSKAGLKVGVVNVPLTYPPEEVNGFLIAGMDAPGEGSHFVYPSGLLKELEQQVGSYKIEPRIRDYLRHGQDERFLDDLREMVKQQGRFVEYLMSNKPWDFFMVVCRATDQIQHYYWRFMDSAHPYHPQSVSSKLKNAVVEIYKDADALVGEIRDRVGPDTHIVVMSDHGQGPDGNRAIYINKWLRSKGFLKFRQEEKSVFRHFLHQEMVARSVDRLKKILPRRLKDFLLNRFPSLRDRVETMLSFSDIDFDRTSAYSEDVRGNVWINLKGRQPKGTVGRDRYNDIREELIGLLQELRDPETGKRITDKVFRREDLYSGELLSRAPDIIFTQPEDTYTYMLRRSRTDRNLDAWVETIPASEIGVWPTSSHTLDGIFLLCGEKISRGKWVRGASIMDLAPTILYLMGLPIPDDMDGEVIVDAIDPDFMGSRPPKLVSSQRETKVDVASPHQGYTDEEQVEIRERLRDLGYIE